MVDDTRSRPLKNTVVESDVRGFGHDDASRKGSVRRDDKTRESLAVLDRQEGKQEIKQPAARREGPMAARNASTGGFIGEHIGRELRGLYEDIIAQPVPERFLELLNKLEADAICRKDGS